MARINNSLWHQYKYKINGFLLILPCYFLYQSLFPEFPSAWETKKIANFEVTPTPYNLEPPYLHHGSYTKDFMLTFNEGSIDDIRQAYLNIGKAALENTVACSSCREVWRFWRTQAAQHWLTRPVDGGDDAQGSTRGHETHLFCDTILY